MRAQADLLVIDFVVQTITSACARSPDSCPAQPRTINAQLRTRIARLISLIQTSLVARVSEQGDHERRNVCMRSMMCVHGPRKH